MSNYKVDITGINTSNLKVLKHEEMVELFKEYQNGNGSLMRISPLIYYCYSKKFNEEDIYYIVKVKTENLNFKSDKSIKPKPGRN